MSSRVGDIIRKLDAQHDARVKFEETHPPITRFSPQEADNRRTFTEIASRGVICSFACHGNYVPKEYGRTGDVVNVFEFGLSLEGWANPEEGTAAYFGVTCKFYPERVCVVRDETLRKAVER